MGEAMKTDDLAALAAECERRAAAGETSLCRATYRRIVGFGGALSGSERTDYFYCDIYDYPEQQACKFFKLRTLRPNGPQCAHNLNDDQCNCSEAIAEAKANSVDYIPPKDGMDNEHN